MIGSGRRKRNIFEQFRDILGLIIIEDIPSPPHRLSRLVNINHKTMIQYYLPVLIRGKCLEVIKLDHSNINVDKRSAFNLKITDMGKDLFDILNWFIKFFNTGEVDSIQFQKLRDLRKISVEDFSVCYLCNCGDTFFNEEDFNEHKKTHKVNPKGGFGGYR